MAPTFEYIEADIQKIRAYIFGDLNRITNVELGCNYAATAIMMCACDLFAYVRYGRRDYGAKFVTDYMGQIDSRYSKIGKTLYKSLRHGVVHTYETKKIQIGSRTIDFCISWRKREHFSVDHSKSEINLNVPKMLAELMEAFEKYVEDLKTTGELRDQFVRKIRERMTMMPVDKNEQQALLNFFQREE
jgi:hypothetical protein